MKPGSTVVICGQCWTPKAPNEDCEGCALITKILTQDHLTPDTVDAQFCSDWLKGEIKALYEKLKTATEALESIASQYCPRHSQMSYWISLDKEAIAEVATIDTKIAREALTKIKEVRE